MTWSTIGVAVQGTIQLDEVQQDYLFALLGTTSAAAHQQLGQPPPAMTAADHKAPRPGTALLLVSCSGGTVFTGESTALHWKELQTALK